MSSISGIINNIELSSNDLLKAFANLKTDLSQPLHGMGIAFSSSLLGLSGSLILGFVNLQVSSAYNNFYSQVENKLLSLTRIIGVDSGTDNNIASLLPYIQALLEQNAEYLNQLQKTVKKNEEVNIETSKSLNLMAKEISTAAAQMQTRLKVMEKMTNSNEKLMPILADLVKVTKSGFGMDDKTKDHIKNIDKGLRDLQDKLAEEINLLTKTVSLTSNNKIIKSEK
jgi:hypothetical protein